MNISTAVNELVLYLKRTELYWVQLGPMVLVVDSDKNDIQIESFMYLFLLQFSINW